MDIAAYASLIIVLSWLLVRAADMIEDAFVLLARKMNVGTFFIGFAVLGIASSLPEISIAISSSINQVSRLSIGNLFGATLVILTLIVALNTFIHKELPFTGYFGYPQVLIALGLISTMILVVLDQRITTVEGIALIAGYAGLIVFLSFSSAEHHRIRAKSTVEVGKLWNLMVKAAIGVIGLLVISQWIVEAAIVLSNLLHISESVVGLLILAIGTNLPELAIMIRARGQGKEQERLAIGNFLGSACANTAILGLLAVLNPHMIKDFGSLVPVIVILGLSIILFAVLAGTGTRLTWKEGLILLGMYFSLLIVEGISIYQSITSSN